MAASRKTDKEPSPTVHTTKKCPECFTYLPLDSKMCHSCGKAVGPVTKLGLAAKPPNVKGMHWRRLPSWRLSFSCGGGFSPNRRSAGHSRQTIYMFK